MEWQFTTCTYTRVRVPGIGDKLQGKLIGMVLGGGLAQGSMHTLTASGYLPRIQRVNCQCEETIEFQHTDRECAMYYMV